VLVLVVVVLQRKEWVDVDGVNVRRASVEVRRRAKEVRGQIEVQRRNRGACSCCCCITTEGVDVMNGPTTRKWCSFVALHDVHDVR